MAKRAVAGAVGIDGYLGPSEILCLADDSANPVFVAADLMAQAEHDPGSCFLLTTSRKFADAVIAQMNEQIKTLQRADAITSALRDSSAIIIADSMDELIGLANRFAAEHVNLQVKNERDVLVKLTHAGAVFVGPYSPVAAGDYIAGPSHCLPTNTTARFSSGISVYEFLKRSSVIRYESSGLAADADSIIALPTPNISSIRAMRMRIFNHEDTDSREKRNSELISNRPMHMQFVLLYSHSMALKFVRSIIRQMKGYVPGEQPSAGTTRR